MEALWRAWEHLRLDGATGISVWWKDHADHHMSVLLAAARSEGTHPSAAVIMGNGAAKAKKSRKGAGVGSERGKTGLTR